MDFNVLEAMHEDSTCELIQYIKFIRKEYEQDRTKIVTRELDLSVFQHVLFKKDKIILTIKNKVGLGNLLKWLQTCWNSPTLEILMSNYMGQEQRVEVRYSQVNYVFSPQMCEITFTLMETYKLEEQTEDNLLTITETVYLEYED